MESFAFESVANEELTESTEHLVVEWSTLYGLLAYLTVGLFVLLAYVYRRKKRSIENFTLASIIYVTMLILFLRKNKLTIKKNIFTFTFSHSISLLSEMRMVDSWYMHFGFMRGCKSFD